MKRIRAGRSIATLPAALMMLVTGCAVGPDFERPTPPSTDRYSIVPLPNQTAAAEVAGGDAQRFVRDLDLPAQWWGLFGSKPLNDLVEASLRANPTLQAADAALRQAMENVRAQEGFYHPSVQTSGGPSRQKNATGTISPTLTSGAAVYNLYTSQLTVSYTADVFGVNRRQVESLSAQAEAQRFQLEAAYVSLTTNVVAAAIQEASLRAQIDATEAIVKIQRQ